MYDHNDYSDIINKKRPEHADDAFSAKHPKMRRQDRAKIFSPFAALRGFEEDAARREIKPQQKIELSEERRDEISNIIRHIDEQLDMKQPVSAVIKYFRAGEDGSGLYEDIEGRVERVDAVFMNLSINGTDIAFEDIYDIKQKAPQS